MVFNKTPKQIIKRSKQIRRAMNNQNTGVLRLRLWKRDRHRCGICHKKIQSADSIFCQIGHSTTVYNFAELNLPIKEAIKQANVETNLFPVHQACNNQQGPIEQEEFLERVRRGEFKVLGEPKLLTADDIQKLKEQRSEKARRAGRLGGIQTQKLYPNLKVGDGHKGGKTQGRRNVETGHMLRMATPGSRSKGGKIGGKKAVESGQLASICTPEHQSKGGKIQGKRNAESGQLARAGHIRWHVNRTIVNPECEFCKGKT